MKPGTSQCHVRCNSTSNARYKQTTNNINCNDKNHTREHIYDTDRCKLLCDHFADCLDGDDDSTVAPFSLTADGKLIWRKTDYEMIRIAPWMDPDMNWYEVCGFQRDIDATFDEVFRAVIAPFVRMLEDGIRFKAGGCSTTMFGTLGLINADMDAQYVMLYVQLISFFVVQTLIKY
jgi:hypothetical protein